MGLRTSSLWQTCSEVSIKCERKMRTKNWMGWCLSDEDTLSWCPMNDAVFPISQSSHQSPTSKPTISLKENLNCYFVNRIGNYRFTETFYTEKMCVHAGHVECVCTSKWTANLMMAKIGIGDQQSSSPWCEGKVDNDLNWKAISVFWFNATGYISKSRSITRKKNWWSTSLLLS